MKCASQVILTNTRDQYYDISSWGAILWKACLYHRGFRDVARDTGQYTWLADCGVKRYVISLPAVP